MKIETLTLAALLAATVSPATAFAEAARDTVSRTITFHDLDLTDAAGRERLDRRLSSAVRRACGDTNTRDLARRADVLRCRREALASAAAGRQLALANSERRTGVAMANIETKRLDD
jgi:UrcA family protein